MFDYPYASDENEVRKYFFCCAMWACVWVCILCIPAEEVSDRSFRLNFVVGLVAPLAALLYRSGWASDTITTPILLSYFIVDTVFMALAPTTKNKNKIIDYFHHFMCCYCCIYSDFYAKDICTMDRNPFVDMMLAEASTPFLQLWRKYKTSPAGILSQFCFVALFVSVRVVYHGLFR